MGSALIANRGEISLNASSISNSELDRDRAAYCRRNSRRRRRLIAFGWYGGKFSHLDFILPLIPQDSKHFCDVFGGSAAVLINLPPAPVETYNDMTRS